MRELQRRRAGGDWHGLKRQVYGASTKCDTTRATLIVSLEAIFLSMFILIAQNRQADFQWATATHDFKEQELKLKTNTELTRQIHVLTSELHSRLLDQRAW